MVLQGYTSFRFTHDGDSKTVFRRGAGPGVVIIHEIPGITPPVERFANFVVDAGFTVFLPHLFGTPGKPVGLTFIALAGKDGSTVEEHRFDGDRDAIKMKSAMAGLAMLHRLLAAKG